jgi:hypothetical protein
MITKVEALRAVALLVLGMSAGTVQAYSIVTVGTQEWLQPTDFQNLSWNEIAGVCSPTNGVCGNGILGATNMDGWTWASNDEMYVFFNSVAGTSLNGVDWYSVEPMGTYLPLFTNIGFGTRQWAINGYLNTVVDGFTRTRRDLSSTTMYGTAGVTSYFYGCPSCTPGEDEIYASFTGDTLSKPGGWFFRAASPEVPVPATLSLVGLSLLALGYSRRTRKKSA